MIRWPRRSPRAPVQPAYGAELSLELLDGYGGALDELDRRLASGELDAVGCHGFLDIRARLATMDYIPHDLRVELARSKDARFLLLLDDTVLQVRGS